VEASRNVVKVDIMWVVSFVQIVDLLVNLFLLWND
jgi:hypothetical protein